MTAIAQYAHPQLACSDVARSRSPADAARSRAANPPTLQPARPSINVLLGRHSTVATLACSARSRRASIPPSIEGPPRSRAGTRGGSAPSSDAALDAGEESRR